MRTIEIKITIENENNKIDYKLTSSETIDFYEFMGLLERLKYAINVDRLDKIENTNDK